jgi:transcriptional regulator with XRE-family HTH domain
MNNIKIRFGRRIRELRTEKAFSQEKFAELTDLDRTYITSIENGKRNISITVIDKLSKGLEISMSELLHEL